MTMTQTRENGRAKVQPKQPQTLEEHLVWVMQLNDQGADLLPLTQGLLRDKFQLEASLDEVRNIHCELRAKLEALSAPQLYPAVITDASTKTTGVVEVYGAGMAIKVDTLPPPPLSPKMVTLPGSPPKASALSRTHCRAAIRSS